MTILVPKYSSVICSVFHLIVNTQSKRCQRLTLLIDPVEIDLVAFIHQSLVQLLLDRTLLAFWEHIIECIFCSIIYSIHFKRIYNTEIRICCKIQIGFGRMIVKRLELDISYIFLLFSCIGETIHCTDAHKTKLQIKTHQGSGAS